MHVLTYHGEALARYGFGHGHPFGPDRLHAFWQEMKSQGLDRQSGIGAPVACTEKDLALFHTTEPASNTPGKAGVSPWSR